MKLIRFVSDVLRPAKLGHQWRHASTDDCDKGLRLRLRHPQSNRHGIIALLIQPSDLNSGIDSELLDRNLLGVGETWVGAGAGRRATAKETRPKRAATTAVTRKIADSEPPESSSGPTPKAARPYPTW